MVFWAIAVVLAGIILKLIAIAPGSVVLVPIAMVAGLYHVAIHREAAQSSSPRTGLAVVSDLVMLGALLMQIDFGSYNCGHTTIDGVLWTFGWSSEYRCTLIRGVPAVLLDVAFYVPAAVTWWMLRTHSREMRGHPRS
jgi:hypothetical protein